MKLTLHIGTEKTGSTSIQRALAARREELLAYGILYPYLFGSENHMELAVAAMGLRPDDTLQMLETARSGLDYHAYTAALTYRLHEEIAAARVSHLLISNEHCHGRLDNLESVRRILEIVDQPIEQVEVIVYLRRQDRMAISMHSTRLRDGGTGEILPTLDPLPAYFDFHRLMSNYAEVFGVASLRPRLFEADRLVNGDVVADFFANLNIPVSPGPMVRDNPSLSREQARFLELFNARFPLIVEGGLNPNSGQVISAIRDTLRGRVGRPSRTQAQVFQAQFDEVNLMARERFLSHLDRPSLFDDDFSEYPEEDETSWPLTESEMMDFTVAIWNHYGNKR